MMSCFVDVRKLILMSCVTSLLAGSLVTTSQSAYADTSWVDLLKPLVKDVLVPGATMGMKKLKERTEHKLGVYKSPDMNNSDDFTSSASSTMGMDSSASQNASKSFTSDESISHNDFEDRSIPTPERGISDSVSADASAAKASALPPPPPVETP